MAKSTIREKAIETLELEAKAVAQLTERIDDDFEAAVRAIMDCKARIVVTGMGKSGHVGRKIAATLASTGTPAFFMHPAEAFHGDLGMVTENDIVIAISNSGESNEVVNILSIIHRIGARIIAMCGRRKSPLGRSAEFYIDIGVEREACPLGLAAPSSTTATLAMGEAIAMALMEARDFKKEDYALFHPGGALGRKLLLTVANVMHTGEENPVVSYNTTAKAALFVMTDKGLGAAYVVDAHGKFIGLVTDGIIRRALAKDYNSSTRTSRASCSPRRSRSHRIRWRRRRFPSWRSISRAPSQFCPSWMRRASPSVLSISRTFCGRESSDADPRTGH